MQKDNATFYSKRQLRMNLLKEVSFPVVLETCGGGGRIYEDCYSDFKGIVFEKNENKLNKISRRRKNWICYLGDAIDGLYLGAGKDLGVNFFDIDPYGSPWPFIDAIFASGNYLSESLYLVVTDGLRNFLKQGHGWKTDDIDRDLVEKYGNPALYENYADICYQQINKRACKAGFQMKRWVCYYANSNMTHYAGVFCKR